MSENSINEEKDIQDSLQKDESGTEKSKNSPGVLSMIQSVLAAMFGVQSEEKRQQDFENGHAGNYIFIGIVMVLIFIFSLIKIVDVILENS